MNFVPQFTFSIRENYHAIQTQEVEQNLEEQKMGIPEFSNRGATACWYLMDKECVQAAQFLSLGSRTDQARRKKFALAWHNKFNM